MRNIFYFLLGESIPRVISLLILPFLSFYLSETEYGIRGYLTVVITNLSILGALSIHSYYIKYSLSKKEKLTLQEEKSIISFHFIFNLFIFLAIFFFGIDVLRKFHISSEILEFVQIASFIYLFEGVYAFYLINLRINKAAKEFFIISVGRVVIQTIAVFILLKHYNLTLRGVYYSSIIGYLLLLFFPIKFLSSKLTYKLNRGAIYKAIGFSFPLLISAIAVSLINSIDKFVLEQFLPLEDFGIYVFAGTIASTLNALSSALYKYLEPFIYEFDNQETKKNQVIFDFYVSALLFGCIILLLSVPYFFEFIIDSKFHESANLIRKILIVIYLNSLVLILDTILVSIGKHILMSKITIISSILAVGVSVIAGYSHGYLGIIVGLSVAALIVNLILVKEACLSIKRFYYSNILGLILLVITGKTIEIFFENELFGLTQISIVILFLIAGFLLLRNGYNRFQQKLLRL